MRINYPLGARVKHSKHGVGTVVDHMMDSRTRVRFDAGSEHRRVHCPPRATLPWTRPLLAPTLVRCASAGTN